MEHQEVQPQTLDSSCMEMISRFMGSVREYPVKLDAFFQENISIEHEGTIDLSSRTSTISWAQLGVMMACNGQRIRHSELQEYFGLQFHCQEVPYYAFLQYLMGGREHTHQTESLRVRVSSFIKLFCIRYHIDKLRIEILSTLNKYYDCDVFNQEGRKVLQSLVSSIPHMEFEVLVSNLSAAMEPVKLTVRPPSSVTSRKSSEGLLGIQSNAISMRLEKQSNANSECRNLGLQAKKSSQHIINTHARSEEVAIQHVRMRTHRILQSISVMGVAR